MLHKSLLGLLLQATLVLSAYRAHGNGADARWCETRLEDLPAEERQWTGADDPVAIAIQLQ